MKFLLFEWNALMQADLEDALTRMNIGYQTFSYQFDEMYEDEYFSENFGRVLKDGEFDAVFSFNCWPLVARACNALHIPYISWIYDSPMPISDPASLSLPTNYIFIFDRGEYVRYVDRGFQTVYHLPLAVNVERLDQIRISEEELPQYVSEVSFVGNMYRSDYRVLESCLTDYERVYFAGLIESQCRVYVVFFV